MLLSSMTRAKVLVFICGLSVTTLLWSIITYQDVSVREHYAAPVHLVFNKTDKTQYFKKDDQVNASHIVYIKVHKAASSTVQAILLRYGMRNNLTFALPKKENNNLGWPYSFLSQHYWRGDVRRPDILCYHAVLSQDMIELMPKDSFYITSLRDPFTQIISLYNYYSTFRCIKNKTTSLMDLLRQKIKKCSANIMLNPQAYDLGMSFESMISAEGIQAMISRLEKIFHFVIIIEYFDESLIVIRDMLGWTNLDILYIKTNFKGDRSEKKAPNPLLPNNSTEIRAELYKHLNADFTIYQHFKRKFEKLIASKRDYLDSEVTKFRQLQNSWMEFCVNKTLPSGQIKDPRFRPYGYGAYGYLLTQAGYQNSTCVKLAMAELPYSKVVSKYQQQLLNYTLI